MAELGVDPWPNDEEMALACRCGHTLGQHDYGTEHAACNYCSCTLFNDVMPSGSAAEACDHPDHLDALYSAVACPGCQRG